MPDKITNDEFVEAFNIGGAKGVAEKFGGDPAANRVRASRLRKKGHNIKKFKSGRPQRDDNGQ